jgi:hypothetical protein
MGAGAENTFLCERPVDAFHIPQPRLQERNWLLDRMK